MATVPHRSSHQSGASTASAAPGVIQAAGDSGESSALAAVTYTSLNYQRLTSEASQAMPTAGTPWANVRQRMGQVTVLAADLERALQMRQVRTVAVSLGRGEMRQQVYFPKRDSGGATGRGDQVRNDLLRNLRHYEKHHRLKKEARLKGVRIDSLDEFSSGVRPFAFRGRKQDDPGETRKILQTWARRLIKYMYWAHFYAVKDAATTAPEYQEAKRIMLELWRQGREEKQRNPRYRGPASEWTDSDEAPPPGNYMDVDTDLSEAEAAGSAAAPTSSASGQSLPVQAKAVGSGAGGAGAAQAASSGSAGSSASGAGNAGAAAGTASKKRRKK